MATADTNNLEKLMGILCTATEDGSMAWHEEMTPTGVCFHNSYGMCYFMDGGLFYRGIQLTTPANYNTARLGRAIRAAQTPEQAVKFALATLGYPVHEREDD